MKDRLLITISGINGIKSYNVHKVMKKILFFIIVFGILLFAASAIFINTLSDKIANLKEKEEKLIIQSKLYSTQIENKIKDIEELSSKLDDIEDIIGLNPLDNVDKITRVNFAKITTLQRRYMLELIPNGKPIKDAKITSLFGYRIHPITHKRSFHRGIDFRAKVNTPIYATADGVVQFVEPKNRGSFGRLIVITHNYGFKTLYAHLHKTNVKVGDVVYKDELIGYSGNSGRSSGPHLHYEVKYAMKSLNPIYLVKWDLKRYEDIFKFEKRVNWDDLIKQIILHRDEFKK